MGQSQVRYTLFCYLQVGIAVVMTMTGLVTLHYLNLAGDGGFLPHIGFSLCFAVVAWLCFRAASLGAWATPEGIVLGEFYTETTVPYGQVLTVSQQNGLNLLLSGGRRMRVPGFEGSLLGEMRGYPAVYGRAGRALQGELDRARERKGLDSDAEVSSKVRLQLWVLLVLTAILFLFAQVNLSLVG